MKFKILYILHFKGSRVIEEDVDLKETVDEKDLQDFYKIFEYNCAREGVQLCVMIPLGEDSTLGTEIFVTRDFQVFQDLDIRKWLSSKYTDRMPIYKNGVFQRLKKI